jgi:anti-anti-sigma regulatory factor
MADDEALRVSSSESPPWLVIAGEIDESTYPVLLAGLAAAEGYREIRIDLGGVRYCDLAGLHRIIRLTEPSSASGPPIRRVVLRAAPSWLAEILQILGWDTIPGIALEELLLSGRQVPHRVADERANPAPGVPVREQNDGHVAATLNRQRSDHRGSSLLSRPARPRLTSSR